MSTASGREHRAYLGLDKCVLAVAPCSSQAAAPRSGALLEARLPICKTLCIHGSSASTALYNIVLCASLQAKIHSKQATLRFQVRMSTPNTTNTK